MSIIEKAKTIASRGMRTDELNQFFDTLDGTGRDIVEIAALFGGIGVDTDAVWNAYEIWQDA